MTVTYFKRFRMQVDLRQTLAKSDEQCRRCVDSHFAHTVNPKETGLDSFIQLPDGYELHPWDNRLISAHGNAKYLSFRNEIDSNVFPCLGEADGCLKLMKEISCRQGFIPAATWLATKRDPQTGEIQYCGTVQGLRDQIEVGSIQNLGIVPEHRGHGLGSELLTQSLAGFYSQGIKFVTLEVTSHNVGAIRLYRRLGFKIVRTVYKSADLNYV